MADITVVHHNLNKKGGGEAICMTVLEALNDEHKITLLTSSNDVELESLNKSFNTEVSDIDIETINVTGFELLTVMNAIGILGFWKFSYFTNIFNHGLFNRYCEKSIKNPDLVISTWDELSINNTSILYIHFPRRYKNLISTEGLSASRLVLKFVELYKSVVRVFANFDPAKISGSTLFANSQRTATQIEEWYNVSPQVLNPPIDTSNLSADIPWEKREDDFVFVGRIHPCKQIDELIEILKQVRNNGHDIHFHVIGPRDEDVPQYYDKIEALSAKHDFVTLEGPMYGESLNKMLQRHKYGINGAPGEQFGMAVAEMVHAGMIPFVPNSGGQREIVGEEQRVMFDSSDEAAEKITTVLSDGDIDTIKESFPDIEEEYGKENFQRTVRSIVDELLEQN